MGFTAPSAFYLAHLSFEHEGSVHDLIGGTLPGIPMLITGRNSRVGWGLTTTNVDAQDLYIEKINPENDNQYKTESGWDDFETQDLVIKMSGSEEKNIIRRSTRHEPVLPDGFRNLKNILPDNTVGALRWIGLADDDITLDTLMTNLFAKSVVEFLDGTKFAVSPMQSVVVGDVDGNIALAMPGRLPVRSDANIVKGRAPVLGWMPKYEWERVIQSGQLPKIINPASGAIATATANFLPQYYPHHVTYDWAEHFRQARAEELVFGLNEKHDVEQSQKIMADDYSQPLHQLVNIAKKADLDGAGERADVFQLLKQWDGHMKVDRPEPLIMLAWFRHLHDAILKDDLGDQYKLFDRGRITKILNILARGTARDWCDRNDTEVTESCAIILGQTLDSSLAELNGLYGSDWKSWQYGKAHIAYSEHRPFGKVNPLSKIFNITIESGGGPYTLHRGQTDFGEEGPYRSRHGAAYRGVYDFSDLNKSVFIQSTGQSGNFLSEHYRDFAEPWSQSKFIPMTTDKQSYAANAKGTWVFNPE